MIPNGSKLGAVTTSGGGVGARFPVTEGARNDGNSGIRIPSPMVGTGEDVGIGDADGEELGAKDGVFDTDGACSCSAIRSFSYLSIVL
jgi:hypothetical protein